MVKNKYADKSIVQLELYYSFYKASYEIDLKQITPSPFAQILKICIY